MPCEHQRLQPQTPRAAYRALPANRTSLCFPGKGRGNALSSLPHPRPPAWLPEAWQPLPQPSLCHPRTPAAQSPNSGFQQPQLPHLPLPASPKYPVWSWGQSWKPPSPEFQFHRWRLVVPSRGPAVAISADQSLALCGYWIHSHFTDGETEGQRGKGPAQVMGTAGSWVKLGSNAKDHDSQSPRCIPSQRPCPRGLFPGCPLPVTPPPTVLGGSWRSDSPLCAGEPDFQSRSVFSARPHISQQPHPLSLGLSACEMDREGSTHIDMMR